MRSSSRDTDTYDRVRHDRVDKSGTVTLRVAGKLISGELLRELTIDPTGQPLHSAARRPHLETQLGAAGRIPLRCSVS